MLRLQVFKCVFRSVYFLKKFLLFSYSLISKIFFSYKHSISFLSSPLFQSPLKPLGQIVHGVMWNPYYHKLSGYSFLIQKFKSKDISSGIAVDNSNSFGGRGNGLASLTTLRQN